MIRILKCIIKLTVFLIALFHGRLLTKPRTVLTLNDLCQTRIKSGQIDGMNDKPPNRISRWQFRQDYYYYWPSLLF